MDEVYERQTRVQQVAQAQVHDDRPFRLVHESLYN